MSEAIKNFREFYGVWAARIGSIPAVIFSLIVLFSGPTSIINGYVGGIEQWMDNYLSTFGSIGTTVVSNLQTAWVLMFITVTIGLIGFVISIGREKIGLRLSGIALGMLFIVSLILYMTYFGLVFSANSLILGSEAGTTYIEQYMVGGLFWNLIFGFWIFAVLTSFGYILGAGYIFSASPIPFAKFRAKRMKILTKADAAERASKPREAIDFYRQAGDLSMKLREEDKATEYYQKSREIEETEIIAVMEREEELKRKELAERRAKLEEERKEILIRADQAEEKDQFLRASTLYRDAAEKSVDLGEKKLAAQFTAKAKDLKRKAVKLKKEKEKEGSTEEE